MTTMTCSKCGIGNLHTSICSNCECLKKRQETLSFLKKTLNRKEKNWKEQDERREAKRTDERYVLAQEMRIVEDIINATLQRQADYQEQPEHREQQERQATLRNIDRLRWRATVLELNLNL